MSGFGGQLFRRIMKQMADEVILPALIKSRFMQRAVESTHGLVEHASETAAKAAAGATAARANVAKEAVQSPAGGLLADLRSEFSSMKNDITNDMKKAANHLAGTPETPQLPKRSSVGKDKGSSDSAKPE
ncbi:MAG: hypothetical protein MHM6MM_001318 [Cercozoa sp. M6MM]